MANTRIIDLTSKSTPIGEDITNILDSAAANADKRILLSNIPLTGNIELKALATGILKNTTATGTPSIAVAGTDYVSPTGLETRLGSGEAAGAPTAATISALPGRMDTAETDLTSGADPGHDHTAFVDHALATAANDFLVASGSGAYVKKTLAEVKTLLALGYPVQFMAYQNNYVDDTTYYSGAGGTGAYTVDGYAAIRAIKAGTITSIQGQFHGGVVGTSEAVSLYLRVNGVDTLISDALDLSAFPAVFSKTDLSVAVTVGQTIQLKLVCPTWVTNPLNVVLAATAWVEL